MVHPWHDVSPAIDEAPLPRAFKAIVEIPKGSRNKYELDKASGLLKLDRVIASAVYYPANYGFIPQTLGQDNDPLDVLVFSSERIATLTMCSARAVGMMQMIDDGQPDHKIIAVLINDPAFADYRDASDFPKHTFKMLKRFLEDYKQLEDKQVEVEDILPAETADAVVEDALDRYSAIRRTGGVTGLLK